MKKRSHLVTWALALFIFASPGLAQDKDKEKEKSSSASNSLVRLLQSKGILTEAEAASVSNSGSPAEVESRLARLLLSKGMISQSEYDGVAAATTAPGLPVSNTLVATREFGGVAFPPGAKESHVVVAGLVPTAAASASAPVGAAPPDKPVIPAVAPIRTLPLAGDAVFKRDGLAPVIKIGSDIKMKPYGIFKASFISDSSSPGGNDFPLPGFLGDTGPGNSPEMHFTARSFRIGSDFEWLDPSKNVTITGKVEADFEGNFSRVNNRNISSIRSNAFQLRLAWARIDKRFSDKTSAFALFGQDWTAFGSSTLPPIIENTGLGLGYGILYERAPQFRFGIGRELGGSRHWKFEPEFAFVLPGFGNTPSDISNQLAFGERQGTDSNRPEIQGRLVTQFQLDTAPGVVPAQFIVSGTYGKREAIVTAAAMAALPAAIKAAFPYGATVESSRYGISAEAQLPTRYFTLLLKGFTGQDLRFYFVGTLFSNFNDVYGLTSAAGVPSIDGSSTVVFGLNSSGTPAIAPQRPVRAAGGFADLAFPLSRIFKANPEGRNAGWTFNMHYSFDDAFARDVRRIGAANRSRDDITAGTLTYKMNKYFSVAFEESYYRTRAANKGGPLPLYRGIPSYQWHDVREQLSFITTF
jgi:peptidoglycan hydrolase-like protein with peptidoglycan-binding domain